MDQRNWGRKWKTQSLIILKYLQRVQRIIKMVGKFHKVLFSLLCDKQLVVTLEEMQSATAQVSI